MYEWFSLSFISGAYLKQTSPPYKPVTVRLIASINQEVAMRAANAFNLSRLRSRSVSRRRWSLTVTVHTHSHGLAEVYTVVDNPHEIFECAHLQ